MKAVTVHKAAFFLLRDGLSEWADLLHGKQADALRQAFRIINDVEF